MVTSDRKQWFDAHLDGVERYLREIRELFHDRELRDDLATLALAAELANEAKEALTRFGTNIGENHARLIRERLAERKRDREKGENS